MIFLLDENHIQKIQFIDFKVFHKKYDLKYYENIIKNPLFTMYGIQVNNCLCGYILLWIDKPYLSIDMFGILNDYQNKGYGQILINYVIQKYQNYEISLEVRETNKKAIHIYQKYNFDIITKRKNYYQDTHEDAYLMVRREKK